MMGHSFILHFIQQGEQFHMSLRYFKSLHMCSPFIFSFQSDQVFRECLCPLDRIRKGINHLFQIHQNLIRIELNLID